MNETLLFIIQFAVGLFLILKGADWLTDGASSIARRFNVSSLVIGLTIVAFGTSAPELVVSAISAIEGHTEMAIGNVVGSNIFNTLAIMGITAMVYPVACSKNMCHSVLLLPSLSLPWQTMLYSRERALAKAAFHEAMASRCSASSSSSSPTLLQ